MPANPTTLPRLRKNCRSFRASPESDTGLLRDSSTVVLDLEDQVQYEAHRLTGPDRIYFDLHDTQLAAELAGKSIDVGDAFISRIRVAQPVAGMTRIVLETKADTNFGGQPRANPYRLIVTSARLAPLPRARSTSSLTPKRRTSSPSSFRHRPKKIWQCARACPRCASWSTPDTAAGTLALSAAAACSKKIWSLKSRSAWASCSKAVSGANVIYTRQDDNYIPLDERAEIANQSQADLFVSVHANYSDLPSARGVETYYTNFFSAPGSKDATAKDADRKHCRESRRRPQQRPTLSPADLHERIEQSRRLAASVQHSLYGTLSVQNPGLRDRGIKEAGFVVLTESAMPGILAEVSFVTSPTDEQKLRSDGYREQIAEALYKGIATLRGQLPRERK